MANYLTINTFGGYARGFPATLMKDNQFQQLYNMRFYPEPTSYLTYYDILSTCPAVSTYKTTMGAAGRGRGLFQFFPTVGTPAGSFLLAFQCVTDYTAATLYALNIDTNAWLTLVSSQLPYHVDIVQFGTRCFISNPGGVCRKWGYPAVWTTTAPVMNDKGNPATIAAATLTWAVGTSNVTSDADLTIGSVLQVGMWIRKSSDSVYWDEVTAIGAFGGGVQNITIGANTLEDGASAAGGAQTSTLLSAGTTGDVPKKNRYFHVFKDKLWAACDITASTIKARLWWSVTSDPENWTGIGSGFIDIPVDTGDEITGIGSLSDYLFIFLDTHYRVYKWTGDIDVPIEEVSTQFHGCASHRTIVNVGDSLIYFTGSDIRRANGSQDISICDGSGFDFLFHQAAIGALRASTFFALAAADNSYPTAYYDDVEKLYVLRVAGHTYYYHLPTNMFVGEMTGDDLICLTKVSSATAFPTIVKSLGSSAASNQLYQYSRSTLAVDSNSKYQFSKLYDFGDPRNLKKVNWVEFEFHPKAGANTTITFEYWDGGEDIEASATAGSGVGTQTYVLTSAAGDDKVVRQRFMVNRNLRKFGWILKDTDVGTATDGWGIVSYTICWEPTATT